MAAQLGATWEQVVTVVVSTVVMYLVFIALVRLVGQRSLASMSSFDFACVVALGAVLGRSVLLEAPTLLIGIVALSTFFAVQGLLGMLRLHASIDRVLNRPAVLLMADGRFLDDNMRRAHVVEDEIRQKLRLAGIRHLAEVQCVVLERNGAVSVIRSGERVDPWLLSDVRGSRASGAADAAR